LDKGLLRDKTNQTMHAVYQNHLRGYSAADVFLRESSKNSNIANSQSSQTHRMDLLTQQTKQLKSRNSSSSKNTLASKSDDPSDIIAKQIAAHSSPALQNLLHKTNSGVAEARHLQQLAKSFEGMEEDKLMAHARKLMKKTGWGEAQRLAEQAFSGGGIKSIGSKLAIAGRGASAEFTRDRVHKNTAAKKMQILNGRSKSRPLDSAVDNGTTPKGCLDTKNVAPATMVLQPEVNASLGLHVEWERKKQQQHLETIKRQKTQLDAQFEQQVLKKRAVCWHLICL
jgi:hypothetical protein